MPNGGRTSGKYNSAKVNSTVTLDGASLQFILDDEMFRPIFDEAIERKQIPLVRFRQVAEYKADLDRGKAHTVTMIKKNKIERGGFVEENEDIKPKTMSFETKEFTVKEAGNMLGITEFSKRTSFIDLIGEMAESLAKDIIMHYETHLRDIALAGGASTPMIYARKDNTVARPTALNKVEAKLNVTTIKDAKELLAVNGVAPFYDGSFVALIHSHQYRDLTDDKEWTDVTAYQDKVNLYVGEIGRIQNIRFIDTNLIWNGATVADDYFNSYKANLHAAGKNGEDLYQCILLSAGYLGYAEVLAPDLRTGTDSNMGRRETLGWLSIWGATILNEENAVLIVTT